MFLVSDEGEAEIQEFHVYELPADHFITALSLSDFLGFLQVFVPMAALDVDVSSHRLVLRIPRSRNGRYGRAQKPTRRPAKTDKRESEGACVDGIGVVAFESRLGHGPRGKGGGLMSQQGGLQRRSFSGGPGGGRDAHSPSLVSIFYMFDFCAYFLKSVPLILFFYLQCLPFVCDDGASDPRS